MIFCIYALADDLVAGDLADLSGVQGEPCVTLEVEHITAIGGWVEQPSMVARETLKAQYDLVDTLHARSSALLPMRFATSVRDVDEARQLIQPRADALRRQFDLVRGREQMILRILGIPTAKGVTGTVRPAGPEGVGRRYLEARAAQALPAEIEPLLSALRSLQRATHVEAGRHAGVVATVYHLIDRGSNDAYRQAVERAAPQMPALTVRISGPSPAYAFTQ